MKSDKDFHPNIKITDKNINFSFASVHDKEK